MDHVLVVGCGVTGSVIASYLAVTGMNVTIWERRSHIGGNMYDYVDTNGICVHKYGPHVFHTNDSTLMKYMQQFSDWIDFPIKCQVYMLGKFTPSPFNFKTIDDYYTEEKASSLKIALSKEYSGQGKVTIVELLRCKNPLIKEYAEFLFQHDYSLYTAKQWGVRPEEIDPSVLKRVPVLLSYEDGYFDDIWQMVPTNGYTDWFKNLLKHPNIHVHLNINATDHLTIQHDTLYADGLDKNTTIVYTGAIDELLGNLYGPLPYRSLHFEWQTKNTEHFQSAPLVAYPEADGFTRITEYSHFPQKGTRSVTSIAVEYPLQYKNGTKTEPYYPILNDENYSLYQKYSNYANTIKNLIYCGRLADYKYYNMDQALKRALDVAYTLA